MSIKPRFLDNIVSNVGIIILTFIIFQEAREWEKTFMYIRFKKYFLAAPKRRQTDAEYRRGFIMFSSPR